MKEDLAEWMNSLYPHIDMDADNFMNRLETGEHLVQVGTLLLLKIGRWFPKPCFGMGFHS